MTLDFPICSNSNEAAQIADKQYKTTLAEMDGTVELSLMLDVALDLAEGDCIGYVDRLGRTQRLRIEQMEFADWSMKITCKADRQSAYTSDVTGLPAPTPELPPSTIVGETVFAIIDGPARIDSEDNLGYLAAATGPLPPWYGAELQRSLDMGASYTPIYQFERAAIIGVLTEALPAASPFYTDTTNTVKVQLYRDGQTIDSLTEVSFLTGQGVFALENPDGSWEYMQGRDVSDEGSNTFHLTTLHRGLLNTDTTQGHIVNARFVWLPDAVHIDAASAFIGATLTHRAVSYGDTEDDTTNDESRVYYGESQREWPVEFLELSRDMSDIISGYWVPRARFGSPMNPVQSINFQGFRVTIDDGSTSVYFDTPNPGFTFDASAMSSPATVSVAPINRITGLGPEVSDTV